MKNQPIKELRKAEGLKNFHEQTNLPRYHEAYKEETTRNDDRYEINDLVQEEYTLNSDNGLLEITDVEIPDPYVPELYVCHRTTTELLTVEFKEDSLS